MQNLFSKTGFKLVILTSLVYLLLLIPLFSTQVNAQTEEVTPAPTTETTAVEEPRTCEDSGWFSWIQCPLLKASDSMISYLDNQVDSLLRTPRAYYDNPSVDRAWARLRNLAYLLLIPILLVMVIGTALGFNVFDAYTIKRALPRMLAATIFIALSLPLLQLAMDINTVIGQGIAGIVLSAVPGADDLSLAGLFNPDFDNNGLIWGGITIAAVLIPVWIGAATFLAIGVLISLFTIFLLLAFRQLLLVALIIFAPLAILSWIFPGNDKLWKLWSGSFWKLMFLYPVIMGLLAVGRVFAVIVRDSGIDGIISIILILVAYIGPFFLIPAAFKFAGGVFANLGGMVNNRQRGVFDRLRKGRQASFSKGLKRLDEGKLYAGGNANNRRGSLNAGLQRVAKQRKAGFALNSATRTGRIDSALSVEEAHEFDDELKNPENAPWINDDTTAQAAYGTKNADEVRTRLANSGEARFSTINDRGEVTQTDGQKRETERYVQAIEGFRRRTSNETFDRVLALQALAGGTTTKIDSSGRKILDENDKEIKESSDDVWERVLESTKHDSTARAMLVSKGRSAGMNAGRPDTGGASFGVIISGLGELEAKYKNIDDDTTLNVEQKATAKFNAKAEFKAKIHKNVIDSHGAGILLHSSMKPASVEELIPAMQENLQEAYDKIEVDGGEAYEKELALVAGLRDAAAQTAPNKAKILNEKLMTWTPKQKPVENVRVEMAPEITIQPGQPLPAPRPLPAPKVETNKYAGKDIVHSVEDARVNSANFAGMRNDFANIALRQSATGDALQAQAQIAASQAQAQFGGQNAPTQAQTRPPDIPN